MALGPLGQIAWHVTEAEHAALAARGAVFIGAPHCVARMPDHEPWMVFFKDPDGHLLALMEDKR